VGVLAGAFNRMSAELVRARAELEQSSAQIQEQASRLQELSIRDGLTGLYNRRHFDERAAALYAQAQRYQQPLTLAVGDIDYFKRINDRFSHAVGDEVLRRVAASLHANLRESDLVARYGGEEFVLALTNTPALQAAQACDKLRQAIEAHPWHEVHPDLRVTMSLGLCDRVSLGGPEPMLGAADVQLYRSKEEGRNRVSWEQPVSIPAAVSETPVVLRQGQGG
jgi:diguanylate cyclase (GGDEF)-like protein